MHVVDTYILIYIIYLVLMMMLIAYVASGCQDVVDEARDVML